MNRVTAIITAVLTIFLLFGVTYYQGRVTALKLDVAEITAVANSRQSAIAAMLIQRQQVAAQCQLSKVAQSHRHRQHP